MALVPVVTDPVDCGIPPRAPREEEVVNAGGVIERTAPTPPMAPTPISNPRFIEK